MQRCRGYFYFGVRMWLKTLSDKSFTKHTKATTKKFYKRFKRSINRAVMACQSDTAIAPCIRAQRLSFRWPNKLKDIIADYQRSLKQLIRYLRLKRISCSIDFLLWASFDLVPGKQIPINDRKMQKTGSKTLRSTLQTFPSDYQNFYDGFNR